MTVGPRSVGYRLTQDALIFGGATLTTSDIAVAAGIVEIGDATKVAHLDPTLVATALDRIQEIVDGCGRPHENQCRRPSR